MKHCKDLLSGGDLGDSDIGTVMTLLESRAGPNQRLVRVFGIDNAFTTTDKSYYRGFRRNARFLVMRDEPGWWRLRDVMLDLVRYESQSAVFNEILLVPFVQAVVLKISLHTLFSLPIEELESGTVRLIAEQINRLWVDSKSPITSRRFLKDQCVLKKALRTILPVIEEDNPQENPLNLILPAYETLWRVVLRGFVEVMFRSGEAGMGWRQLLATFLADPTSTSFKRAIDDTGVSVAFIVTESLRLYPPTRRIYRHIKRELNTDLPGLFAADIEYLHRDPDIWGEESLRFKPSRWIDVSKECQDAYMPFGWKSLTCPAKDEFGPRMIGVAVAALVAEFKQDWTWSVSRNEDAIDRDGPLEAGRDAYTTLELRKISA